MEPIPSMNYKYHIPYKQYHSKRSKIYDVLDHGIFILTRDYLHDKIGITSNKGYSSVGRAPRLHVRQCFSGESIIQSNQKNCDLN